MSRAEMVMHRLPILPGGVTPCCGRQPGELREGRHAFTGHRSEVTCNGRAATRVPWGMLTVVLALGWMLDVSATHGGPGWSAVVLAAAALVCLVAHWWTDR